MIPASRRAWTVADPYTGPRPGPNERLISITSLINAPRIVRLLALQRADLPADEPGSDTWKLLGTSVHASLERAAAHADPPPLLVEHRASTDVTVDGVTWTVSGQNDVIEADGVSWDYKVTSAWSVSDGRSGKGEWASQLNVLRWLFERSGAVPRGTIKGLAVWAILRDWSATQARRDAGYPQSQEIAVPLPLWPLEETGDYVTSRIRLHEAARRTLPECSPEERWAKDAGFAVMRSVKAGRATAVFDTKEAADRYLAEAMGGKGFVEVRPGVSVRCNAYCPVRSVCSFAKNL